MVRNIWRGRCSDARSVHDAEQRLGNSVTSEADSRRSSQGIRSARVITVKCQGVRVIVVLVEDLLYTHEPEVDGVLSVRLDEVNSHCAHRSVVVNPLCIPAERAQLGDTVSEVDGRKQGCL